MVLCFYRGKITCYLIWLVNVFIVIMLLYLVTSGSWQGNTPVFHSQHGLKSLNRIEAGQAHAKINFGNDWVI